MATAEHSTTEAKDHEEVYKKFKDLVNMTAPSIEKWLDTEESKAVGQKESEGSESVGHKMGKKIVAILGKKKADLTSADYEAMHKVVSYISRHTAQKPKEVEGSNWLYSLKNWGHDPQKAS